MHLSLLIAVYIKKTEWQMYSEVLSIYTCYYAVIRILLYSLRWSSTVQGAIIFRSRLGLGRCLSRTGSLYTTHATRGRCRNAWVSAARDIIADEHVIGCPSGVHGARKSPLIWIKSPEVLIICFGIKFFFPFRFHVLFHLVGTTKQWQLYNII